LASDGREAVMLDQLKRRARQLKQEVQAIAIAARDPRTPWYAKALVFFVVAHTLSPIDLIPDFIPVLGYLDDLVLVPLGITLVLRMIPKTVLAEYREKAQTLMEEGRPTNWTAAGIIIALWIASAVLTVWFLKHFGVYLPFSTTTRISAEAYCRVQ